MRLLLDTHILLWAMEGSDRLSALARKLLSDPANVLYVSAVTLWEIWMKFSLGKLAVLPVEFHSELHRLGIVELALTGAHARAVADLPWHHRDPFDRMLVAQATVEHLTLVTADRTLEPYGPTVMVV